MALLAAGLLGLPLAACSRAKAPDVGFTPTKAVKETSDPQVAFDAAKEACVEEARRKGISSVTRILLLRGKVSKSDYIDCMEAKGYDTAEQ